MKDELRSLSLAILLSFIAIYSVNYFFGINKKSIVQKEAMQTMQQIAEADNSISNESTKLIVKNVEEVLKEDKRLSIKNNSVSGSIRLKGARFDNLYLTKYNIELDKNSGKVELLQPAQTENPYFAEIGWLSLNKDILLPSANSLWTEDGHSQLTPETPVILSWTNDNGIVITRKISIDNDYLFTIEDTIQNESDKEITIFPYALINRSVANAAKQRSVVHEGVSSVIDGTLKEFKYADINKEATSLDTVGGWLGYSDRYWFSAFILGQQNKATVSLRNTADNTYQIDYLGSALTIPAHKNETYTFNLFAGAKEIQILDKYKNMNGFPKFDLAVDFGWYYFLTKPFFYILDFLYGFLGNMGWAILLFAALLRLCMFPIANKSYTSMAKMKALQPKLQDIKTKYGDNQMLIQQATMELYKKEKINPASGCLPLFIQIPIFFSLYKVLNFSIELRHAPFIGWIKDLSAPDPLTLSQIFHIYIPGFIDIGLWPIFMGFTMWIQQKLNPTPTNNEQARVLVWMPVFFTFMLGHFAAGLVIYWTLSNLLSIIQQKVIMRKNGVS